MTRLPWPLVFQVIGVGLAVFLVLRTWEVWLLFFTGLIVAAAILPAARWAERYRIPRGVTVFAVYVGVAGVFTLMGSLLWPALTEQWRQFTEQLPKLVDNLRTGLGQIQTYLGHWGGGLRAPKPEDLQALVGTVVTNTFSVTAGVVGFVVGLFAIVVIAAYLVVDGPMIAATIVRLTPSQHRARIKALGPPVLERIGGYVRGQMLSSLVVGAVLACGMALLGVKYALLIGALAAVLNVVPFVGSLVAAVLGILSALNESLALALATAALFWGTNLLEGKYLAPHFVGRATGLHPLAVLLALFGGLHLGGLIGALVAVPLLAGAWEVVRQLYFAERA